MNPFISICIPAYKNVTYLATLLNSVAIQTYKNYEVIITDDSPGDEVKDLCQQYHSKFTLKYLKNEPAKGSPANWNASIKMAAGEWVKIMHDDDWFADETSLGVFAQAAIDHPGCGFIFSGYSNYENGKLVKTNIPGSNIQRKLADPLSLIAQNYIGHPSTTLIKKDVNEWYDEKTSWVVDFEFYIRCLRKTSFFCIEKPLIYIGINNEQITKQAFRNRDIELPENLYLLNKMGDSILKNISVYDHYWRLFRNLHFRNIKEVEDFAKGNEINEKIKKMLQWQFKIPLPLLKIGPVSKLFMALSFYTN